MHPGTSTGGQDRGEWPMHESKQRPHMVETSVAYACASSNHVVVEASVAYAYATW